jgi:hypothetical protein
VKLPVFNSKNPEEFGFSCEPDTQQLRLGRIASAGVLRDYWRTDTFSSFGDFLGSLMLVRIKVPDMETMYFITKLALSEGTEIKETPDLPRIAAAEDLLVGIWILVQGL